MTLTHLLNNGGGATTVEPKCGGCPIPLLRGHYVKKFLQTDAAETVPVEGFYAAGSQLTGLWRSRVKRTSPPPPRYPISPGSVSRAAVRTMSKRFLQGGAISRLFLA
ncbi:unnamed protein product [Arctogadus glacialis]